MPAKEYNTQVMPHFLPALGHCFPTLKPFVPAKEHGTQVMPHVLPALGRWHLYFVGVGVGVGVFKRFGRGCKPRPA
ncbi:MAG: hypothetical protein WCP96_08170 [Methylococcaceae bacterium]